MKPMLQKKAKKIDFAFSKVNKSLNRIKSVYRFNVKWLKIRDPAIKKGLFSVT